ncbi:hypothetical protein TNCV_542801 [Trichonephila clavipes]|nr:hypothetical protein TNCV_542801 [Trichonephila clavipes]
MRSPYPSRPTVKLAKGVAGKISESKGCNKVNISILNEQGRLPSCPKLVVGFVFVESELKSLNPIIEDLPCKKAVQSVEAEIPYVCTVWKFTEWQVSLLDP